jgi:hypothetical protein
VGEGAGCRGERQRARAYGEDCNALFYEVFLSAKAGAQHGALIANK